MNMMIFWLVALAALLVLEGLTAALTTIWFAGGALIAAILAFAGVGLIPQFVVFLVGSSVLLVFTRPLAKKALAVDKTNTNVDSLIGQKAVVTETIDNLAQTGKVLINDVDWTARTEDGMPAIEKKAVVTIKKVQGVKLIVSSAEP